MSRPGARWPRLRRSDPHTLAGAYALDALTSADRVVFERHLSGCDACQAEAASLREAAARLGAAAAMAPPPGLRARVLASLPSARQLPPVVGQEPYARRGVPWQRVPRLAGAVAAACLLLALAFGALVMHTQHRLSVEQGRTAAITAVLNSPDATMMTEPGRQGGSATVVMSHARRALVLTTAQLPALPASERYEVWLMSPHGARSAGMLPPAHHGMTPPVVVSGLAAGDELALTSEPASGAASPDSPMVLALRLPS
jgi:anti-sigma-K factor RskA